MGVWCSADGTIPKASPAAAIVADGVRLCGMLKEAAIKAFRHWLWRRRLRRLRRKVRPFAEAQGIFTDEDVFRIFDEERENRARDSVS